MYVPAAVSEKEFDEVPFRLAGLELPSYTNLDDAQMLVLAKSDRLDFMHPGGAPIAEQLLEAGWTPVYDTGQLLKYGPGDYNCLHQDLYGDLVFPLQLTVLLSEPEEDFTGGEFLLVEQRPRAQSRGEVVPLQQGEAVIFPVHHRPVEGTRGPYRVTMRHGVSRLRSGQRHTLGIIFHDAA